MAVSYTHLTPQIQIIDEDDFQMHTNLSDEQIDEIVEVLQAAKQMVKD